MPKVKFTTTIDSDLLKQAKIEAVNQGVSVAEIIEKLLKEYFAKKTAE